jgi:hypothetical protein
MESMVLPSKPPKIGRIGSWTHINGTDFRQLSLVTLFGSTIDSILAIVILKIY